MRLAGLVSEGSGAHNEDAAGVLARDGEVVAAWVFDGVTGINDRHHLPAPTDAAWLVNRADHHVRELAGGDLPLPDLLRHLVERLQQDWRDATKELALPTGYDIPAACLLLAKRYADGWRALRLGDSVLLAEADAVRLVPPPPSDLGGLEASLREEARHRRAEGVVDFKALLQEFRPRLLASRLSRNTEANHSILVAHVSALNCPEFIDLGWPKSLLLCTDGYYRAVDTYGLHDDTGLVQASQAPGGVRTMLDAIRRTEAADPQCIRHLRFKPADDASAVMLSASL